MTWVLDASAAAEIVIGSEQGLWLSDVLRLDDVIAPEVMDAEVVSAVRALLHRRVIDTDVARQAVRDLVQLPIKRARHRSLLEAAFELKDRFTAYDAIYVVLALAVQGTLITLDRKLARAAGLLVPILDIPSTV